MIRFIKIGIDYDGWEEEEGRLARSCASLFCPSRSILRPSPPLLSALETLG